MGANSFLLVLTPNKKGSKMKFEELFPLNVPILSHISEGVVLIEEIIVLLKTL